MIIEFLSQSGPRAHKHSQSWVHPITTFILHYFTITISTIYVHDFLITKRTTTTSTTTTTTTINDHNKNNNDEQYSIAKFTFLYFCILLIYRILLSKDNKIVQRGILYEGTWLCNSTLYMATVGLCTDRYILVLSYVVTVSIDQVLWYVDLTGWVLR